jgi:hypothetical protein
VQEELAVRNEARCGLLVHVAQTLFSEAEHAVDSKAPRVQVVQGMQVASEVCIFALE